MIVSVPSKGAAAALAPFWIVGGSCLVSVRLPPPIPLSVRLHVCVRRGGEGGHGQKRVCEGPMGGGMPGADEGLVCVRDSVPRWAGL